MSRLGVVKLMGGVLQKSSFLPRSELDRNPLSSSVKA